jgi:hypothetical protein
MPAGAVGAAGAPPPPARGGAGPGGGGGGAPQQDTQAQVSIYVVKMLRPCQLAKNSYQAFLLKVGTQIRI